MRWPILCFSAFVCFLSLGLFLPSGVHSQDAVELPGQLDFCLKTWCETDLSTRLGDFRKKPDLDLAKNLVKFSEEDQSLLYLPADLRWLFLDTELEIAAWEEDKKQNALEYFAKALSVAPSRNSFETIIEICLISIGGGTLHFSDGHNSLSIEVVVDGKTSTTTHPEKYEFKSAVALNASSQLCQLLRHKFANNNKADKGKTKGTQDAAP